MTLTLSSEQKKVLDDLRGIAEQAVRQCVQGGSDRVDRNAVLKMVRSAANGSAQLIGFRGVKGGDRLVIMFDKQPFDLHEFVFPSQATVVADA